MLGKQSLKADALGVVRDAAAWRIGLLLTLSFVIHLLVFTPLGSFLGLLALLARGPEDTAAFQPITTIPISLIEDDEEESEKPQDAIKDPEMAAAAEELIREIPNHAPPKPEPKPEPRKKPEAPKPAKPKVVEADAGVAEPKASKPKARKKRDPNDAGTRAVADAGATKVKKEIADPAAMIGSAAKLTDAEANVRLLIFTDRIRGHVLGERIGTLLGALPQWQSFLGGSGIDAVRDLDRIYVTGPQFRRSDEVMALLGYNVPEAKIRAAIDVLVKRSSTGKWLDAKFPAAIARADRADRLFALPRSKLAVVSPLGAMESVLRDGPKVQFPKPKGDEAVIAHVNTPWRVFMGTNLSLPESILWAKLRVTPHADGGIAIEVVARDASAEAAKKNAPIVADHINELTQLGGLGAVLAGFGFAPLIDRISLRTDGATIRGELSMTSEQVRRVLNFVESWAEARVAAPQVPPSGKETKPRAPKKRGQGGARSN